jgi:hypothetical protein
MTQFGFAHGTLAEHEERGEKRFTLGWRRAEIRSGTTFLLSLAPKRCWPEWGIHCRGGFKGHLQSVPRRRCFKP